MTDEMPAQMEEKDTEKGKEKDTEKGTERRTLRERERERVLDRKIEIVFASLRSRLQSHFERKIAPYLDLPITTTALKH